jgi:membrane protease YdiL (CAAX protease family)
MVQVSAFGTRDAVVGIGGLVGLGLAVAVRVGVAGPAGAQSVVAGAVFGLVVLALAAVCGAQPPVFRATPVLVGVAGAAVLCAVPLVHKLTTGTPVVGAPDPRWVVVVGLVAAAEELLLRGALFAVAQRWRGDVVAVGTTAVAFALLHVPVYGWHVAVLDLAVGVWLGVLRVVAGTVTAPILAHVLADLAGWWLQ